MSRNHLIHVIRLRRPLAVALVVLCGCSEELETGYKPHRLNANPTQRRAYYASPFSPEAEEVAKDAPPANNFRPPSSR